MLAGRWPGATLKHAAPTCWVNGPHLPNIAAIAETSRGELSATLDLGEVSDRDTLRAGPQAR